MKKIVVKSEVQKKYNYIISFDVTVIGNKGTFSGHTGKLCVGTPSPEPVLADDAELIKYLSGEASKHYKKPVLMLAVTKIEPINHSDL